MSADESAGAQAPEMAGEAAENPSEVNILTDLATRVDSKERALCLALGKLKSIRLMVKQLDPSDTREIPDWVERSVNLEKSVIKREWLVGLIGDTGAGKSTATNALLGFDISPTNSSDACTAAPCIYSYNHSDDPSKVFGAIVTFKSREAVMNDIDLLQEELSDIAYNISKQDNRPDQETISRRNQAQKQLKIVQNWSGLTEDDIRELGRQQITSKVQKSTPCLNLPDGSRNHTEMIYDTDFKRFRKHLKPYIDSSSRNRSVVNRWPLVQQVEILLKSDVLRHGIKLVDLPGVADSLESRAAVAKGFLERIDKLLVVVHAVRAADNKTGSDAMLLPATLSMDMSLEGNFEPSSLAVIVTKIDDINVSNAEDDWPDDNAVLEASNALQAEKDHLAAIEENIVELKDTMDEKATSLSPEEEEEDSNDDMTSPRKRKRPIQDTSREATDDRKRIFSMQRERHSRAENVRALASDLRGRCIEARNRRVKEAVGQNLSDIKALVSPDAARQDGEFESSIFPISATAFIDIKAGETVPGFADAGSTGVPGLEDWLARAYLPKRDNGADDDIQDAQVLFDALDPWVLKESSLHLEVSAEEEQQMKDILSDKVNKLAENLKGVQSLFSRKLGQLKPLRETMMYSKNRAKGGDEAPTTHALEGSKRAQEKWVFRRPSSHVSSADKYAKLSHMTFKACVKRNGREWTTYSKPRITYNWMSSIELNFWRAHGKFWNEAFLQKLPGLLNQAEDKLAAHFSLFIDSLLNEDKFPDKFRELLRRNVFVMQTQRNELLKGLRRVAADFREDARRIRPEAHKKFDEHMAPGFATAKEIKGKGAFRGQQEAIKEQFDLAIHPMLIEAREFIETQLLISRKNRSAELLHLILGSHSAKWGKCCSELHKLLATRLKDACAPAGKSTGKVLAKQSDKLKKVKEAAGTALGEWRRYWQPIALSLPKRERAKVSSDSEDEDGDDDDSRPQTDAKGKSKPKPKPTSKTKATPKAKPKAPARQKAAPKKATAKAQPKSAVFIKKEDDSTADTEEATAAAAPQTSDASAAGQHIGAIMAVAEASDAPSKEPGNTSNE